MVPPPDLPAVGSQVSLLRFPKGGGPVQAYHPDSLGTPTWVSLAPVPPIRRVLGVDLDERMAWAIDAEANLIAVDLETRTVRKLLPGIRSGVVGPNGSIYLADSAHNLKRVLRRNPVDFHDPLPGAPTALFGAGNDQLIAVVAGPPPHLITTNPEEALHDTVLPEGDVTSTFWGDLVAVAADTAVVLYETGGRRNVTSLRSRRHARKVAFSPSGHRIYVAEDDDNLTVYDRFTRTEIGGIRLPSPARALRVDASGRWMLVRPIVGDSIRVVDLATNRLAATVVGSWSADLPLVAGASTLVSRVDDGIVALDLRQAPPKLMAKLTGMEDDLWLAAAWVPRDRVSAAVAAAESATVVQDSALALVEDAAPVEHDSTGVFLQVSTSQNPAWAANLAGTIKAAGFPSRVLDPRTPDDGYRVVVGPYPTREIAEENGRKLGRPFFILREPAVRP